MGRSLKRRQKLLHRQTSLRHDGSQCSPLEVSGMNRERDLARRVRPVDQPAMAPRRSRNDEACPFRCAQGVSRAESRQADADPCERALDVTSRIGLARHVSGRRTPPGCGGVVTAGKRVTASSQLPQKKCIGLTCRGTRTTKPPFLLGFENDSVSSVSIHEILLELRPRRAAQAGLPSRIHVIGDADAGFGTGRPSVFRPSM